MYEQNSRRGFGSMVLPLGPNYTTLLLVPVTNTFPEPAASQKT